MYEKRRFERAEFLLLLVEQVPAHGSEDRASGIAPRSQIYMCSSKYFSQPLLDPYVSTSSSVGLDDGINCDLYTDMSAFRPHDGFEEELQISRRTRHLRMEVNVGPRIVQCEGGSLQKSRGDFPFPWCSAEACLHHTQVFQPEVQEQHRQIYAEQKRRIHQQPYVQKVRLVRAKPQNHKATGKSLTRVTVARGCRSVS
jgi:hypothetical protein